MKNSSSSVRTSPRPLVTPAASTSSSLPAVLCISHSITTWWWRRQPPLQPQTTMSCCSTASCPTAPPPPPPLAPSCSSTNRAHPQPLRWTCPPTGRATRAAPAAWSPPAASAILTRPHTPHTIPGWWPAGAALKQLWQLFTAGYLTLYRWTDSRQVEATLWARLRSSKRLFDCRVKFWSRNYTGPKSSNSAVKTRAPIFRRFPSLYWPENSSESSLKGSAVTLCW